MRARAIRKARWRAGLGLGIILGSLGWLAVGSTIPAGPDITIDYGHEVGP